jgi:hypothetical protein
MNKHIEWKKSSIDYSKLSEVSHAQLMRIENGKLAKESGQLAKAAVNGGKAVIKKLNKENKKSGHWRKLGDSKIGKHRDVETIKKIQKGTQHSWRDISQFTKDGIWMADYINFTEIENRYPTFSRTNICNCCKHYELKKKGFKSSYGFIWKYKK